MAALANHVAQYLINQSKPNSRESITNLKLQKLLYYAQGFYLALYNEPLFEEEIQARAHGPVVPAVYSIYKKNGYNDITEKYSENDIILTQNQKKLLDDVWEIFKSYDGKELEKLSHSEDPWLNARGNLPEYAPSTNRITEDSIREYFLREYILE